MSKDKKLFLVYIIGDIENTELKDWLDSDKEANSPLELIEDSDSEKEIWFYAFTTSKKELREFMNLRDTNKLVVFEKYYDDYFESKVEFDKFKRQFRKCEIIDYQILTRSEENGKVADTSFNMKLTQFEKEFIDISFDAFDDASYEAFERIGFMDLIFGCLTDKVKSTLKDIGFIDFIIYLKSVYGEPDNTNVMPMTALDELLILLKYFNELFEGGMKE